MKMKKFGKITMLDNQELKIEDEEQSRVKQNYLGLKIKGKDHR
jgi:hypothetical protein